MLLDDALGGYFELELPKSLEQLYCDASQYQSARAAFYALLKELLPSKVYVPYYICDSMISPLVKLAIEIEFYSLNHDFSIKEELNIKSNELLLYVNYFGVCSEIQKQVLKLYPPNQVIFDHSQAYFQPPFECLATIYSPRKFFGVPDGGLIVTKEVLSPAIEKDDQSINRSKHLIERLAFGAEYGYQSYQEAEKTLDSIEPKHISELTLKILKSINYDEIKKKRNENFQLLHDEFKDINKLNLEFLNLKGPMSYPLLLSEKNFRDKLANQRIYTPTYWRECLARKGISEYECSLVKGLIPLPCDQRYGKKDMKKIIDLIRGLLHG